MAPRLNAADRVRTALAAGHTVREVQSANRSTLVLGPNTRRPGRGRPAATMTLMVDGKLTEAGQWYQSVSGTQLHRPNTWIGSPFYVGNSQYVEVSGLGRKKISGWVRDREVLTGWGRKWFREFPTSYIIHTPIIRTFKRRNGTLYTEPESTLAIEWDGAPHESAPSFREHLLAQVRAKLPDHYTTESVHEIKVLYDKPLSEWRLTRKNVRQRGGVVDIDIQLDMPLRAPDGRHSFAARPENITDLAFVPSENCCVTQLAPRLNLSKALLEDMFQQAAEELYARKNGYPFGETYEGDWEPCWGVTPKMILWVCKKLGRACHGFADNRKVLQFLPGSLDPDRAHRDSISFSFGNGHLWLFDPEANASLAQRAVVPEQPRRLLHRLRETPEKTREELQLLPWPDDPLNDCPPPGAYYTTDHATLLYVRQRMLEQGRCPRVFWADTDSPRYLRYVRTKAEGGGVFTLRALPAESEYLELASATLQRECRQQALGPWTQAMLRAELKGERGYLRAHQKRELLASQNNRCARCGDEFSDANAPEFDHILPHATGGTEMQALCRPCHLTKSADEYDLARAGIALESHLSDQAWDALVENGVQGVQLQVEAPPIRELRYLDKNRCRTSILLSSRFQWPVAIPQDEVRPFTPTGGLGQNGFFYVDIPVPTTPAEALQILPLRGPGWYFVAAVECAIIHGIITMADIRYEFVPSASVKGDKFAAALGKVLLCLPDDDVVLGNRTECNLRKDACNKLVGLWGRRDFHELWATCSQTAQDEELMAVVGETLRRSTGVGGWVDIFYKQKLIGRHTFYLLHRAVLDQEAVLVAVALKQVREAGGRVYEINTDSILYHGPHLQPSGWSNELTLYRRLRGTRRLLTRNDPVPPEVPAWRDLRDEEEAMAHVLAGGSLCIEAAAGTGKTTLLKKLMAALRDSGRKVQACSTTHVATSNLEDRDAQTLARLVNSFGVGVKKRIDTLLIDEMSMVHTMVWSWLASVMAHSRCQVICCGDWSQLGPPCDSRNALACPSMRGRAFLRQLCGHTRLRLTQCRRSDGRLFAFYTQLADSTEDVKAWVERARAEFPDIPGPAPINLCVSHKLRVRLNAELQEVFKPEGVDAYWTEPGPCNATKTEPQGMWLWLNQELYCASTNSGLRNRWPYRVVELTPETAVLQAVGFNERTKALPHKTVASLFRLGFARTVHAAQGLTFDCRVRIWGWSSPVFTTPHLLVAMSRATRSDMLDFGPE